MIHIDTMVDLEQEVRPVDHGESGRQADRTRKSTILPGSFFSSVAGRINIASIGVSVVLVALGAILSLAFVELSSRHEEGRLLTAGALASAELTASISDTRYYTSQYAVSGESDDMAKAHAAMENGKRRLEATRELAVNRHLDMLESIEWLQAEVIGFEGELTAIERSVSANGPSEGASALARAIDINGEQLANNARSVERRLNTMSGDSAEELSAFNARLTMLVIGIIAAITLLSLIGFRYLAHDIAGRIRKITAAMTGLAGGDKNIEIPGTKRHDEIGEMARALVVFRQGALELAELQKRAAKDAKDEIARREEIKQSRIALTAELAARFEQTVGNVVANVAAASTQLQDTANSMASTASQSSTFANEVAKSMDGTTTGVTAAASATDQFSMSIGEISQQAASSASLARQARITAEQADSTISGLSSASEEIGEIVELIRSIAERTNLLALNASIEAARGGEAGRGFAVVATEVKELANRTSLATDQVATQIEQIQRSSHASVTALKTIEKQIREVEGHSHAIAQSVDEQSVASQELARNLDMAADGTGKMRTSIGQVREMSLTTGSAASQVLSAASGLQKQAVELRVQVDEFLGYVKSA